MKKGMLPLEITVIAVILLITLALFISWYLSKPKDIQESFFDCESKKGVCTESAEKCMSDGGTPVPFKCGDASKKQCCLKI